jgi:hypothetical protein
MSFAGLIIELLVGSLLAITIGYCALLNRRLKKMRADEDTMRSIITELVKSTETAERAILGLRATASECNKTISARITEAREIVSHLDTSVAHGRSAVRHQPAHAQSNPVAAAPAIHGEQDFHETPVAQQRAPQPQHHAAPAQPQPQPQLSQQDIAALLMRERDRLAAAERAAAQPPAPVNDVPDHMPQFGRTSGGYDDLEASLAEIARRNRGAAA